MKPFDYKEAPSRDALREELELSKDTILFGSVGRFSPEKAPDDLVEAFLHADIKNSHLVLFGTGELEAQLKQQIVGHEDKITLMGYAKQIRPWYKAFDIFVLPSRSESFGLVLLEAMDANCPIVTTNTDGAKDLLGRNQQVYMAEVAKPESLTNAMKLAAKTPIKSVKYSELALHQLSQAKRSIYEFYNHFLSQ